VIAVSIIVSPLTSRPPTTDTVRRHAYSILPDTPGEVNKIATLLFPASTVSLSISMISSALVIFLGGLLLPPRALDAFATTALPGSKFRYRDDPSSVYPDHCHVRATFRDAATRRAQTATTISIRSGRRNKDSIRSPPVRVLLSALSESAGKGESDPESVDDDNREGGIDLALDPRLYRVRLPRTMGIDWKTDLSFRWVSVRGMDPTGAARYGNQDQC
jgi:hypothetical protein